jgi:acyl-CoA thioesterase-1
MNKTFALAALVALAACGKEPAPVPKPKTAAQAPAIKIIAFGDSLTAGKDLPDPFTQAYPALLEKRLREKGENVAVANAGQSGDTTYDALNRLDFSVPPGADIVLIAFGANDTFQGKPVKGIEKNLTEIVRRVQATGARPILVAMKTLPNLGPVYGQNFEALYKRVAQKTGATLAPFLLEGVAGQPGLNLPDGVHPNARGHEIMADHLFPTVEEAVKERKRERGL